MIENVNLCQLKFGEFKLVGTPKTPQVEIHFTSRNGVEVSRYLTAFRDYRFQVCDTPDGFGDSGSSPVFGLYTFSSIEQKGNTNVSKHAAVKYIISACALSAINAYCNLFNNLTEELVKLDNTKRHVLITPPNNPFVQFTTDKSEAEFVKFIEACFKKYYCNISPELTCDEIRSIEDRFLKPVLFLRKVKFNMRKLFKTLSFVFYPTNKINFILKILLFPIVSPFLLIRFIFKSLFKTFVFISVGLSNFFKVLKGRLHGFFMKY